MSQGRLDTLAAVRVIAEEGSFTRAAARMGMSQSALSHAVRVLEERLGHRLLARTTRSVAPTAAGAALLKRLSPALDDIDAAIAALHGEDGEPSGPLRLTMGRDAAEAVVFPVLPGFIATHPRIEIEIDTSDALADIVAGRFDGGIRLGERLEMDMIARRISDPVHTAVVASPAYLDRNERPQRPEDLSRHRCIGYRMHSAGRIHPWRFASAGRSFDQKVKAGPVFNDGALLRRAALDGLGLVYLFRHMVEDDLRQGRLVSLLDGWCASQPGFHLYYPSRKISPAMAAFAKAIVPG